jgi:maleate isomerase
VTERSTADGSAAHHPVTPRVGLLLPSTNTVMEPDLWRAVWPQASLHACRLPLEDVTAEAETRMLALAPAAAGQLAALRPSLTVFGCTSAGGILGREGERDFLAELSVRTGSELVSVLEASTEVMRAAGIRSIALFTPYVEHLSAAVASSLEVEGFAIERVTSLGLSDNTAIGSLHPRRLADVVCRQLGGSDADAIFVSCTNLRAMEAIDGISRRLERPVITSNSAVARVVHQRLAAGLERSLA